MKGTKDAESTPEKKPAKASPAGTKEPVYVALDFTEQINKYIGGAYESQATKQKHFSVPVQMKILREFCKDNKVTPVVKIEASVNNLVHSVVATIEVLYPDGNLVGRASGASSKYAFNYAAMSREAATEIADTVATGRALAKLGITPDGTFTSEEENIVFQYMKDNSSITERLLTHTANLFAGLPIDMKNAIKEKGLQLKDLQGLVDSVSTTKAVFETRVADFLNSRTQS
jgi:hypothetical protein